MGDSRYGAIPGRARRADRSGKTTLYLTRHGETSWNLDGRFQGRLAVPLSAVGSAQARALAGWLSARPHEFAAVYSSDTLRAMQTAKQISNMLGCPLRSTGQLSEMDCGEWEGLSAEEIEHRYPGKLQAWHESMRSDLPPGGESVRQVQERALCFYARIVAAHSGEAVVVVSHAVVLSSLLAALAGWDLVDAWRTRRGSMGNTGVTMVQSDHLTGKHQLVLLNSQEHLEGTTATLHLDGAGQTVSRTGTGGERI